ncbi:MAG TPA: hypothetical protein VFE51_04565 [Verrucomicrobiae bacterium]|nr:hypothetical protein [Verrucomicrobiae bacterium]
MKIHSPGARPTAGGYALLMVMVLMAVFLTILVASFSRTSTIERLNNRNNVYIASQYAAEAATEKVVSRMKHDYLAGNLTYITNDLATYRVTAPTSADDPYWSNFKFSDAQGHVGQTYVQSISNTSWGSLGSQYSGLNGWVTMYRVLSNAQQSNSASNPMGAVQQDIQLYGIPVFQFAIFYNGLLEFTWCAPFTVNGRTHSNTNIYDGSSANLTFNSTVTASGTISQPAWFGKTPGDYTGTIAFNGSPGYSTNVQTLTLPIGTNNSPSAVAQIIAMPPTGEDPNSAMGQQRYYNKAEVLLLVSNSVVVGTLKTSSGDPLPLTVVAPYTSTNYSLVTSNFPFLSLTNSFTDQRENKTVIATDIDVSKLKTWLVTNPIVSTKFPNAAGVYNSGAYPNILYVADNRPSNSSTLPSVRLYNGGIVPTNMSPSGQPTGFTVATPNPLYVKGDYNNPSGAQNSTDTSATFPASLISDALTILSKNWVDSQSSLSLGSGSKAKAVSTTINAAILAGNVPSTGSDVNSYSGGVMNLPRLLEDWGNGSSSVVLTINTSMVNLFSSSRATTQFQSPGVYYYAPTRKFSFDLNFMNQARIPPGTPILGAILRSKWAVPPPGVVTYAGN